MLTVVSVMSVFYSFPSYSANLPFDELWKRYLDSSEEMESVRREKDASALAAERGRLHWLPNVSLMGQWSDTDDPGQVFFNNLGQRSITQADFNPSTLNDPDRQQFVNGMVSLNLPLYEGGMKTAQASMLGKILESSKMNIKAKQSEHYSELSRKYGALVVHGKAINSLEDLQKDLNRIISGYQVGSKSNPVGYSGLLGLKGVSNRIVGMLTAFKMQSNNTKVWISQKAGLNYDWEVDGNLKLTTYLDEALIEEDDSDISSLLATNELQVSSLNDAVRMERARYLPRIGLFANNMLYSGDRDTENSQSIGVYVMWQIFNTDSYNRMGEARARALAAEAKLRSGKQDENIMRSDLRSSKEALEKNLSLLTESTSLLDEQSKNSMRLFRSGLLTALQLAEVINRRVDVVEQRAEVEMQYLDVRSRLYQLSH